MLFHAPIFLFVFLPVTLIGWILVMKWGRPNYHIYFLCLASIIFYGWWNVSYLWLLLTSIGLNYVIGVYIVKERGSHKSKKIVAFAIGANLLLLVGFKYAGMLSETLTWLTTIKIEVPVTELPLGISFFTFLQIAYLIDLSKDDSSASSFSKYFLFVTFFPHLIAGPLVHHKELIPQFDSEKKSVSWEGLSVGLTIFIIGLFKKLVLSQQVSVWSDAMFNGVAAGVTPSFIDSWVGVLSFTLQIYFDFSAYSDMALGLAKMFDIRLPENFNSPYKSTSIIDFWRRWHITLSRFLRDYLYVPLGGNQNGQAQQYVNLMVVMLLAGLWHGASWQFVVWGGIHGIYLLVNHFWRKHSPWEIPDILSIILTFTAVLIAWVPFRAVDMNSVVTIYNSMFGFNGVILPEHYQSLFSNELNSKFQKIGITFGSLSLYGGGFQILHLFALLCIVWFMPNTQQYMCNYQPCIVLTEIEPSRWKWSSGMVSSMIFGITAVYLILLAVQGKTGEFIYFQF